VQKKLSDAVLLYVDEGDFENKRLLDFGCGCGASTVVLARMFPRVRIVGVELVDDYLSIARSRAELHGLENAEFRLSPSGDALPDDIGSFDYVMLSAVYEHLLPHERAPVLRQLWSHVKEGGVLFVNQTPNRFFPVEKHTTGLPLLNYLPAGVALRLARRFSKKVSPNESWESLLRRGIRGATEQGILKILRAGSGGEPVLLKPKDPELRDPVDVWYRQTTGRYRAAKLLLKVLFKCIYLPTGMAVVPNHLLMAIRKKPSTRAAAGTIQIK
jgi:2-polyprenyl-3-methyl-5-hydroxy-6-metoxy-1,4-benzoquinol methylase